MMSVIKKIVLVLFLGLTLAFTGFAGDIDSQGGKRKETPKEKRKDQPKDDKDRGKRDDRGKDKKGDKRKGD
jgi:hypothetical protein